LFIEGAALIEIAVGLVVAIVTTEVNWLPKATLTLSGFGEAVSVPTPPPPDVVKVTVITTEATPVGAVGVRVTLAVWGPGDRPAVWNAVKVIDPCVVAGLAPLTVSHILFVPGSEE
jgi:hypothetical protein